MYGKKDLSKLVKKTIVDKNGISRIVWVKRDDKKTKKPKKAKKEKEDKTTSYNERNYKPIPTEDLIREAKELGISWKESSDSRINRMRVIMKLKEYYVNDTSIKLIDSSKKEPRKSEKPTYLTEKEYKKYGSSYTQEKIEKAREIGILGEDESSEEFLKSVMSYNRNLEANRKLYPHDIYKKFPNSKLSEFLKSVIDSVSIISTQSFLPNKNESLDSIKDFYTDDKQFDAAYKLMFTPVKLNSKALSTRLAIRTATGVNQFEKTLKVLNFLELKDSHDSLKKVVDKYGNSFTYYMLECMLGNRSEFDGIYATKDTFKSPRKDLTSRIGQLKEVISNPSYLKSFTDSSGVAEKDVIAMLSKTLDELVALREEFKEFEKIVPSKLEEVTINKFKGYKLEIKEANGTSDGKFSEVMEEFKEVLMNLKKDIPLYRETSETNNIPDKKVMMTKNLFNNTILSFDESLKLYDASKGAIAEFDSNDYSNSAPKLLKQLAVTLESHGYSDEATQFLSGMNTNIKSAKELQCSLKSVSPEVYKQIESKILEDFDKDTHHFKYKIKGIYEVKNLDLEEKYNSLLEERKSTKAETKKQGGKSCYNDTFYHGTSYGSLEKILGISGKFETPKSSEQVSTGSMLGMGVYLADKSSKSLQYCGEGYGRGKRSGALLICEASLGASSSKNTKARISGKNNGKDTVFAQAGDWGLLNNEWCVPNDDAVLPKYVIDVEISPD